MACGGERLTALAAVAYFEGDGDAAEASTALIITVNWQHDAAVKQAAPDGAEPSSEPVGRGVGRENAVAGGIQFTHGS